MVPLLTSTSSLKSKKLNDISSVAPINLKRYVWSGVVPINGILITPCDFFVFQFPTALKAIVLVAYYLLNMHLYQLPFLKPR